MECENLIFIYVVLWAIVQFFDIKARSNTEISSFKKVRVLREENVICEVVTTESLESLISNSNNKQVFRRDGCWHILDYLRGKSKTGEMTRAPKFKHLLCATSHFLLPSW